MSSSGDLLILLLLTSENFSCSLFLLAIECSGETHYTTEVTTKRSRSNLTDPSTKLRIAILLHKIYKKHGIGFYSQVVLF